MNRSVTNMINEPSADSLIRKLGSEQEPASKYALCVVVAKRARQIIDQAQSQGLHELPGKKKEITLACLEIESGKVTYTKD